MTNRLRTVLPSRWVRAISLGGILLLSLALSCGGDEGGGGDGNDNFNGFYGEDCRFDPDLCGGDIGANCDVNADCDSGFCCDEASNCGGGMCTLACDRHSDCPSFMACEHKKCFFRCDRDSDCAQGQSCEHGSTICEWP